MGAMNRTPTPAEDLQIEPDVGGDLESRRKRLEKARRFQQENIINILQYDATNTALVAKLRSCSTYLRFRHYTEINETRLVGANYCKSRTVCIPCEIRRGANYVASYTKKFRYLNEEYPRLIPQFVTLTIKNTDCPSHGHRHLVGAFKKLSKRASSYRNRGGLYTEWAKVQAFVSAQEFTRNPETKQWHPHLHICLLATQEIDPRALSREWHEITGDSYIVDVRPFQADDLVKSFCEVFKYSVKPSGLTAQELVHLAKAMKGKHLIRAGGLFRGVQVDDYACDEIDDLEQQPYIELVFRWSEYSNNYYIDRGLHVTKSELERQR